MWACLFIQTSMLSPAWCKASQADLELARALMCKQDKEFDAYIFKKIKAGKDLSTWYELQALSGTRAGAIAMNGVYFPAARNAARLEPKNPHIITTFAMVLALINKCTEAQKIVSCVLADYPDDARAHAVQALILAITHESDEFVREEIERAIKLSPDDPDVNNMAYRCYKRLLDLKNSNAALNRWVNCKPTDIMALRNRIDFNRENKQFQASINDCRAASKINPSLIENSVSLVRTYMEWKKYREAIEASKFLDQQPLQPRFLFDYTTRAGAYSKDNQPLKAIKDYSAAIKILSPEKSDLKFSPNVKKIGHRQFYVDCWLKRCSLLEKTGNDKKALTDLNSMALIYPTSPGLMMIRVKIHEKLGDYDLALRDVNFLLVKDPEVSEWHLLKIKILKAQGKAAEAKKAETELKKMREFGDQKTPIFRF